MKKIYILAFALSGLMTNYSAQTTYTWTGATNSSFTTTTNWSPNGTPGSSDDIIFNGSSSVNCDLDADIQIVNLTIGSGYGGTINAQATLPIILGNFSQAAGTFISSSDLTSGGLTLGGNMSVTGGTFSHNGGVVTIAVTDQATSSISGSITFNELDIVSTGIGAGQRNVNFGTSTTNTLALAGGNRLYGYQGSIAIQSACVVSGSNTGIPSSNSATFTFDGAGPISITGAGAAARNKLPNIVINTTGTLTMTNQISVQGNWTGTQGTVNVGSSTVNMYGSAVAISGTAAAFDNLVIETGAGVSMPANAEVKIGGTLTRNGALTFQSTSVLGLNGSGAQTLSGTSITLGGIRAYSGSRTITISTPVVVLDFLQVDDNVTFASGGNITLRSTSALTARLGQLGTGASVTGNVVVETAIPGGSTGWANLGIRGVTGRDIKSWDTFVSSAGLNGIPMTCDGCDYGVAALGSDFYSIQGYDEVTGEYDTTLVATDPLTPGKGFWVYVGDGQSSSNDLLLVNTGPLVQGPMTVNTTAGGVGAGFNLVANPYPSPISWDNVYNLNTNQLTVNAAIHVYNADFGYTSYSAGGLSNPGLPTSIDDVIPGGQGFYVENPNIGFTSLDFDETVKVSNNTSANPLLKPAATNVGQYFRLKLAGSVDYDVTTFRVHPDATPYFDKKLDAHKIFTSPDYDGGSYSKYTTISSRDAMSEYYSIHSLPLLTQSISVPILAKVSTSGTYTISAYDFQDFTPCLGLVDKVNNSYHDLRQSPYVFSISDTTSSPRFDLILCRDEAVNPTGISQSEAWRNIVISQDQRGAFVKTQFAQNTKAVISAYNLMGQKLINEITVEGTNNITHLNLDVHNQVVIIKVTTDKESLTKKIVAN